ncbi:MAG: NADH-quinone oxidoreductase subunit J [Bacteroidetes bacterium]|nr:MAG: NADH-quinone oxidoreductase subunit J [Bacteroidota bacterium]
MSGSTIIFYLLAALTLVSGFLAVTSRMIFRSAIFLLFSLFGIAGLYLWLQYEFIFAVQIVVYVGGIAVLIIFSIFLTQKSGEELPSQNRSRRILSALAALAGMLLILTQIYQHNFVGSTEKPEEVSVARIGSQMLDVTDQGYALPFEVVSMLLLAAMIGCIVIAMRSSDKKQGST